MIYGTVAILNTSTMRFCRLRWFFLPLLSAYIYQRLCRSTRIESIFFSNYLRSHRTINKHNGFTTQSIFPIKTAYFEVAVW
jgi:hypothetical protein